MRINTAPIAVFVYNRPAHTRQMIEALQRNALSEDSDLVIFSDAPKLSAHIENVDEVRQYIHSVNNFKSVTIVERESNYGLAASIIDGVTRVCNQYGRVIVLEDDLVTSPYFLTFMNNALDTYQDQDKVMHISGYMFPINNSGLEETFFLRTASCWGWATWGKSWDNFRKDPKNLILEYSKKRIANFNMDGAYHFWDQVEQNESGVINTWAIFWYATIHKIGGLCLHPAISMVNNIGHDETGEHCKQNDDFFTPLACNRITYFEKDISENSLAHSRTRIFFKKIKGSFFRRIIQAIKRNLVD